jgi:DNA-binding transcriptional ArsR family regulator
VLWREVYVPAGLSADAGTTIDGDSSTVSNPTPSREYRRRCTVMWMETTTHGQVLARFGHALSDPTRSRLLLALREAPGYPAELAELLGVSRQSLSNHLACLRGCGLVVAVPEGRRMRYVLADGRLAHALGDLLGVVLAVDPTACAAASDERCC